MSKNKKKNKTTPVKDWISPSELPLEDYGIECAWNLAYSPEEFDAEIIAQKELGFFSDEDLYDDFIGSDEVFRGSAYVIKWKEYYMFFYDAIDNMSDDDCVFFYTSKERALEKFNHCDEGDRPIEEQIQDCVSAMNRNSGKDLPIWLNVKYCFQGYYYQLKYDYMLLTDHSSLNASYFLKCIKRFEETRNNLNSRGISLTGIWKSKGEFNRGEANQTYYCFEIYYKGKGKIFKKRVKSMYQGEERCTLDFFPANEEIAKFISSVDVSLLKAVGKEVNKQYDDKVSLTKKYFKGDIVITDPCYFLKGWDWEHNCFFDKGNTVDYDKSNSGLNLDKLGFTTYLSNDTIYGDWNCAVFNTDNNTIIGEFSADVGKVAVVLLDELLKYNPDFEEVMKKHDKCISVIKDFKGTISFEKIHEEGTYDYSTEFRKKGDKWSRDKLVVRGAGNVNFVSCQI